MDNGKENGNYYSILGSYIGIIVGKENGTYYSRVQRFRAKGFWGLEFRGSDCRV